MRSESIVLRCATLDDCPTLERLIRRSARALGAADYTSEQIEAALGGAWGLDTQLIIDGTFFVALLERTIVGCGGWSWRRALFGGDGLRDRDATPLDPKTEPAKIRGFFVDPAHARKGIASRIVERCENEARQRGFGEAELGATIPGRRFYLTRGYSAETMYDFECAPGVFVPVAVMRKRLANPSPGGPITRRSGACRRRRE